MAGLRVPLSTLRRRPCDRQRMTRGRDGWLGLSRVTLAFTTPCRFGPAHCRTGARKTRVSGAKETGPRPGRNRLPFRGAPIVTVTPSSRKKSASGEIATVPYARSGHGTDPCHLCSSSDNASRLLHSRQDRACSTLALVHHLW